MDEMVAEAVKSGSSVLEAGVLWSGYIKLGKWYRSKERKVGKNPFCSYMLNKKWTMEEELNNHLLRFQQVTVSSLFISVNCILTFQAGLLVLEVLFKAKPEDDKPKPLILEHFYLPLGIWSVGTMISLLCFIAEIIINHKSKANLPSNGNAP